MGSVPVGTHTTATLADATARLDGPSRLPLPRWRNPAIAVPPDREADAAARVGKALELVHAAPSLCARLPEEMLLAVADLLAAELRYPIVPALTTTAYRPPPEVIGLEAIVARRREVAVLRAANHDPLTPPLLPPTPPTPAAALLAANPAPLTPPLPPPLPLSCVTAGALRARPASRGTATPIASVSSPSAPAIALRQLEEPVADEGECRAAGTVAAGAVAALALAAATEGIQPLMKKCIEDYSAKLAHGTRWLKRPDWRGPNGCSGVQYRVGDTLFTV